MISSTFRLSSFLLAALFLVPWNAVEARDGLDRRVQSALDKGSRWLKQRQNPDGGYGPPVWAQEGSDVGVTAFALYALARNPRGYKAVDGPFISRAVAFLLARQQANGAFYDPRDPSLQNYKTSVAVLALTTLDAGRYAEPVAKAAQFLRSQQLDERQGYDKDQHLAYGGVGYGSSLRPDLSNTQFNQDALVASGASPDDEVFRKALVYVRRSLNTKEVDGLLRGINIGTTGDGGARYAPNITRGPEESWDDQRVFSSYGSMSYAALKAFLYAGVDRNDPHVQGLIEWIRDNWTVRENPGMATAANPRAGQQGYFYYLHTLSKALSIYGEPVIQGSDGVAHVWVRELSEQLLSAQTADGSWVNRDDRWLESLPELATSYALATLSHAYGELRKEEQGTEQLPEGKLKEEADSGSDR